MGVFLPMRHGRRALMVAMLATALCADRAIAAAPRLAPQVGEMARQIAGRLSSSFRRTVPSIHLHQSRQEMSAPQTATALVIATSPAVHNAQSSPFQFRLPPPTV